MLVKEKMADSFLNFLGDCEKKKNDDWGSDRQKKNYLLYQLENEL